MERAVVPPDARGSRDVKNPGHACCHRNEVCDLVQPSTSAVFFLRAGASILDDGVNPNSLPEPICWRHRRSLAEPRTARARMS